MKNKKSMIILIVMMIMIINIPYFTHRINNIITLLCEFIIGIYLLSKNKYKINRYDLKEYTVVIIFAAINIICTFINVQISTRVLTAIVYGMQVFLIYYTTNTIVKEDGIEFLGNTIFKIVFFIIALSGTVIWLTLGKGIGGDRVLSYYIIGNKFTVSYFHILFLTLYQLKLIINKKDKWNNDEKITIIFLYIYSILVSLAINCNTGIIGIFATGIFSIILRKEKIYSKLSNPVIYLIIFIILTVFLVGPINILDNQLVQGFIINVLHRSPTLTRKSRNV